ncbi:MAG TPA: SURF1 family protein [Nocardioides sp.]|uniref:SURF1 family cytochrome oxidase biogenesis protein n=1 Tax=Nocardioides sp. TaxID=35761 RepID=UPI002ED9D201
MRSFGFLLSRRWALFALVVVVVATATWWLGQWQFDRLEDRRAGNDVVRTNETRDPEPVADVLAVGRRVAADDEWRLVTATGSYDTANTIVWRYRTDGDGAPGVDVVVPLITADGTALLVDRGWLAAPNNDAHPEIPAPPAGEVTITGYIRQDGTGDSIRVTDHSTRALSSVTAGEAIGRPTYGGWVHLRSETPPAAEPLRAAELPELDNGPHFFYGLQWWFFGVLAVGGFLYLLWEEWRSGRATRGPRPTDPVKAERQARKQAVRDAYRAAYEKERSGPGRS